jgi:hypothetical protein
MTHREVIEGEVVERYVLNSLSPDDRRAFQEHFFECGDCFAQAQDTSRFVAGVREASRAGVLPARRAETAATAWAGWFKPAFAAAAFASVALASALGWLLLGQIPRLREDVARERQAREQAEREGQQRLAQAKEASEALAEERQRRESERARLESEREKLEGRLELLAQNRPGATDVPERPSAVPRERSQANAPLVILDAVRGAQAGGQQLTLGGGSNAATIWIEVGPGGRFDSYRLQILKGGRAVETVSGAKPNAYGAVAVTVPSRLLRPGKYQVKLFGVKDSKPELAGEYDLTVRGAR